MTAESAGARQTVHVESGYGYGVVGADLHVFPDRGPVYLLVEHRPPPEADTQWLLQQPSRMLSARYHVVDFTGRQVEYDALADWRDAAGPRLSVRWLHAPGGQGKTRLAAEFAAQSRAAGWKVVSAVQGPQKEIQPPPGSHDLRLRQERGLVLVVDYADRWPVTHLNWLFSNALLYRSVPTRVLLLARSLQPWPVIRAALTKLQADAKTQSLMPLADEIGERERMFTAARDSFAARYGLADPAAVTPPSALTRPDYGLVLALHMAALVAVDAHVHGLRPPEDMAGLSSYLLDREREHWQCLYAGRDDGKDYSTPPSAMTHTVFTAALTGAMAYERGATLLRGLDLRSDPARLLADHAVCYPPTEPGAVLEPLYPDRLAEDYLALTFPGHTAGDEHPPAPWAASTAKALAARAAQTGPPTHIGRLITFLASAAAPGRWPHLAPHLGGLLRSDPPLALAAGSAALTALADVADLDLAVLEAVEAHFPPGRHADLDPGIAAVTARLTRHRLADATDPFRRVDLLMKLATRLVHAGLYEEALAADDEAVVLLEGLAADDPARYEPVLAVVLGDRGVTLMEMRRWREAAADQRRAADLHRRPAGARPAVTESGLAADLSHLGVSLSHLGEIEEALEAEQEAVEIVERLASANPRKYEPDLASSLSNFGNRLSEAGRWEEALSAADRAVTIRRRLAKADPGRETPGLARSLSNLGQRLRDLGRWEEGLRAEQEAVGIFEHLAEANPAAYELALARSLANLATHLLHNGQPAQALARAEQALAIRRRLAEADPEAHELELAETYATLGVILAAMGRHDEALVQAMDAVRRLRRLTDADPAAHRERLARALASFAKVSIEGGHDLDAAISATGEATEIYHALGRQNPAAYAPYFQTTFALHADVLHALGRTAEAGALRRLMRTGDPTEVRGMMLSGHRTPREEQT